MKIFLNLKFLASIGVLSFIFYLFQTKPDKFESLNEYVRIGYKDIFNEKIISIKDRDVSSSLRHKILDRDHHRCVICLSKTKLEVDHRIALMNGGSNEPSNLFTLCDICHTEKTRMDRSINRQLKKRKIIIIK